MSDLLFFGSFTPLNVFVEALRIEVYGVTRPRELSFLCSVHCSSFRKYSWHNINVCINHQAASMLENIEFI